MNKDLRCLFFPGSVAVVGASPRADSLAGAVLKNLAEGGFDGALHAVHPRETRVFHVPALPSISDLPQTPDLAVIGIPARFAEASVREALDQGTRAIVLLTAGFGESGAEGQTRQKRIVDLVRERGAVLLGPNCMGLHVVRNRHRLDASFSRGRPETGSTAVLCQSGSIGEWLLLRMAERQLGIGLFASLGNMADLDFADLIRGVATHLPEIRQIILYLETMPEAGRLREALSHLRPDVRILAIRGGTTVSGVRAVGGHTGALADEPALSAALLAGTGIEETESLVEAIDAAELLERLGPPPGSRIGVVTNAGGPAILSVDRLESGGAGVPVLSSKTARKIQDFAPPAASATNPVDLLAAGDGPAYRQTLETMAASGEVDAYLAVFMHPVITDAATVARELIAFKTESTLPGVVCWMGGPETEEIVRNLRCANLPVVPEPERAAHALARWTAAPHAPGGTDACTISSPDGWLSPAPRLGSSWGDPEYLEKFLEGNTLRLPEARRTDAHSTARQAALELGFPVMVKLERKDTPHKKRSGLLVEVAVPEELDTAVAELLNRALPDDRWLVQRRIPAGSELFAAFLRHPRLGSFLGLGLGGAGVEARGAVGWLSLPATPKGMWSFVQTWVERAGISGSEAAAHGLAERLASLAGVPEVVMAEINPAIWDAGHGVFYAVDVRWQPAGDL